MNSTDLVIRTERNLIDVVIGTEGEVKIMRRELSDFKEETMREFKDIRSEMGAEFKNVRSEMGAEFKNVRSEMSTEFKNERQELGEQRVTLAHQIELLGSEVHGLSRTVDTMTTIFGWGFALVAIAVALAPMLREIFIYRRVEREDDELERKIREILETLHE